MAVREQPINKAFLTDLMSAIEMNDMRGNRKSSQTYKPSSLVCMRQMYYMRSGEPADESRTEYQMIGMADTGSRRHEAIQDVLEKMEKLGYDWRYVNVAEYIANKHAEGKLLNIDVVGQRGAETKLFDKVLNISFMCDGIVQRVSTGKYYLFEFKNQTSFKYSGKEKVDEAHVDQVTCYCMSLDLSEALVTYENRDVCMLECPEVFLVTEEMKQACVSKILECEGYVERMIPPPMHPTTKPCRWCQYQTACKKAGK